MALSGDRIFHEVTLTHVVKQKSLFNSVSILIKSKRKAPFDATVSLAAP